MKKIFLDTNVVIDYLAKRTPFGEDAVQIFSLSSQQNNLCISALSFTTIYYVLKKYLEHDMLITMLEALSKLVEILPTDHSIITSALHSDYKDFEDAVQYNTALAGNASVIVTRNPKDFKKSIIPIYTPTEFLQINHWTDNADTQVLNESEIIYIKR